MTDLLPERLAQLPRDPRGYPIPYFAALTPSGEPDFRAVDERKRHHAIRKHLCGLCGQQIRRSELAAFMGGPSSALHGTYAELPAHEDCARAALRLCPYLFYVQSRRTLQGGHALPGTDERKPPFTVVVLARSWHVLGVIQTRQGLYPAQRDDPDAELLLQPRQVQAVTAYYYRGGQLDLDHPYPQDLSLAGRHNLFTPMTCQDDFPLEQWAGYQGHA